jgi:hypothetical protein
MSKFDAFDRATGSDDNDVVRDGPPTCPTSMEILELALEIGSQSHSRVAQHARSCAECQARVAGLRRVLGDVAAFGDEMRPNSDLCFDEAALAELVDGLPPDDQSVRVAHLATCRHCRAELAAFIDLMADESVSAEIRRLETPSIPRGRRKRSRLAVLGLSAAGIAAALLVLTTPRPQRPPTLEHRAPTITASDAPALVTPVGDVDAGRVFQWTPVREASRYRLTLFDGGGHVVFEKEISDTLLSLPDSVALAARQSYLWKVEAGSRLDRWAASPLTEFRVVSRRAP